MERQTFSVPQINNDDLEQEAYQSEVAMTGYYNDPLENVAQRKDPAIRTVMTKTSILASRRTVSCSVLQRMTH